MKLPCWLVGHDWSMYSGYNQLRPHPSAKCLKCGYEYVNKLRKV